VTKLKISIIAILFGCVFFTFAVKTVEAQCTETPSGEYNRIYRALPSPTPGSKPVQKTTEDPPDNAEVEISENTTFLVSVDNDADSGYSRRDDLIPLTVAENVVVADTSGTRRCVVIPAGKKIYGIVDFAKGRTPFAIKGRAQLKIYVDLVEFENGHSIIIDFTKPGDPENNDRNKIMDKCDHFTNKMCIMGRRTRPTLPTSIISTTAGSGVTVIKDSPADSIVFLSLIKDLANSSGVQELINQNNSTLKGKSVYMVQVKRGSGKFWMPVNQAGAAKPDAKTPKDDQKN
jgi:hypothetical protein